MCAAAIGMNNKVAVFASFLVFESTVGMFYPVRILTLCQLWTITVHLNLLKSQAYGHIKSSLIPEEVRSSVMTLFRVPLNMLVMIVLLKVSAQRFSRYRCLYPLLFDFVGQIEDLSLGTVLSICAAAHFFALLFFAVYYHKRSEKRATHYHSLDTNYQFELKGNV